MESYWQTSLDLLSDHPGIDLYDRGWLIYTKSEERAPALIGSEGRVTRSMISHGCVIHSILSPGVRVEAGAVVRDSIVMFDSVVGAGATVDKSILDKDCVVGAGSRVGDGSDLRPNRQEPERLFAGITLVGKRARIPAGMIIGRNCRIDPTVDEADFGRRKTIRSGETVAHPD